MLNALYQTFLDERRFLKNCSPKTLRSYTQAWNAFEPFLSPVKTADEIRSAIKAEIIEKMNAGKMRPSGINVYVRALNAFLRCGSLEEHLKPAIKGVALLKTPTKVIPTLTEAEVQRLFVIDEDGKEHEMEIVKKVLRQPAETPKQ